MDIFGVKDDAGIGIHQNSRFRTDFRTVWPVLYVVGLDGERFTLLRSGLQLIQRGMRSDGITKKATYRNTSSKDQANTFVKLFMM